MGKFCPFFILFSDLFVDLGADLKEAEGEGEVGVRGEGGGGVSSSDGGEPVLGVEGKGDLSAHPLGEVGEGFDESSFDHFEDQLLDSG